MLLINTLLTKFATSSHNFTAYLKQIYADLTQSQCLLCPEPTLGQSNLCHECISELPFISHACSRCGHPLEKADNLCGACISHPPKFDGARCCFQYDNAARTLIHLFKFKQNRCAASTLLELCCKTMAQPPATFDLIVPVPQHPLRLLRRGFNPAALLANALSIVLKSPVNHKALRRKRNNSPVHLLNKKQRKTALRQSFLVNSPVTGLRILLVDDIITTGATANAIAAILHDAGAHHVEVWAIARTVKKR